MMTCAGVDRARRPVPTAMQPNAEARTETFNSNGLRFRPGGINNYFSPNIVGLKLG